MDGRSNRTRMVETIGRKERLYVELGARGLGIFCEPYNLALVEAHFDCQALSFIN